MPESLTTPQGRKLDLEVADREFAAAMAQPEKTEDVPAPPKREPRTAADDGKPKRRGRPPKTDRPKAEVSVKDDYSADAQALVGTVWTVGAAIPLTQAYAWILNQNADGLAAGLAEGAKHNAAIRKMVDGGGGNSWALQLGAVGLNMGMQTLQLMKDPGLRLQAAEATRAQLKEALAAQGVQLPEADEDQADGSDVQAV